MANRMENVLALEVTHRKARRGLWPIQTDSHMPMSS
jgi:hypothetical protein